MLIYRIVHKKHSESLFTSGQEGRWNSPGSKVIYAAESIPLAFLENMVRRHGLGFNNDFKIMFIRVPDTISMGIITATLLPLGWRNINTYASTQAVANEWHQSKRTLLLKVASAVMPEAYSYVIHAEHPEYKK